MTRLLLILSLIAFCGCSKKGFEKREDHIIQLIDYLKKNELDTTIFYKPFFNNHFRAKSNPYNMYFIGLKQMQIQLRNSDDYEIKLLDTIDGDNVFRVSTTPRKETDLIYFLVREDGIDSFTPFIKGGEIVSWF